MSKQCKWKHVDQQRVSKQRKWKQWSRQIITNEFFQRTLRRALGNRKYARIRYNTHMICAIWSKLAQESSITSIQNPCFELAALGGCMSLSLSRQYARCAASTTIAATSTTATVATTTTTTTTTAASYYCCQYYCCYNCHPYSATATTNAPRTLLCSNCRDDDKD